MPELSWKSVYALVIWVSLFTIYIKLMNVDVFNQIIAKAEEPKNTKFQKFFFDPKILELKLN